MKTVLRILAIVLVITAVAGATWAIGQTEWATQQFGFRGGPDGGRPRLEGDNDDDGFRPPVGEFGPGGRPDFDNRFGDQGRGGGFNIFAVAGFMRTLVPLAILTTIVVLLSKGSQWFFICENQCLSVSNSSTDQTDLD